MPEPSPAGLSRRPPARVAARDAASDEAPLQHRIARFLGRDRHAYCPACVSFELDMSLLEAQTLLGDLNVAGEVRTEMGVCAQCLRRVLVARAA